MIKIKLNKCFKFKVSAIELQNSTLNWSCEIFKHHNGNFYQLSKSLFWVHYDTKEKPGPDRRFFFLSP